MYRQRQEEALTDDALIKKALHDAMTLALTARVF